ncbi:peptidase C69 [Gemella sp. oral taxon 928]|uniref:C69 family dipeptidase n=1 Tax=Gemella sp. oral taxon 928 TaxID=1785995 RepID=UPI000767E680|nr:C69 family dipeptidase [Gemella sp. oral taxon 928]AME08720.1 peptidase C69 [Gemella sp. oral taxon 928]
MGCTTILVGKNASFDGSTMVARTEDSPSGVFRAKKFINVSPEEQPRKYKSAISKVEIDLPNNPVRYTAVPNAILDNGIWGQCGANEYNVSMSATETITSNERVLGADPLVEYKPAIGTPGDANYKPEQLGGIGEEDIYTIVMPYITSAREGVTFLGNLLEKYGTYEMNGIAFQDENEIWWLETIGGHHWMARRVPDDSYVIMPNQLGIDKFNWKDAYGAKKEFMCSADLKDFVKKYHLDLSIDGEFNPRHAFGSRSDADHTYNTPRAWILQRYFNPTSNTYDGINADYRPDSDNIPWARVPEKKITVEDIKYALSHHYQGTEYDSYSKDIHSVKKGSLRPIGINRTNFLGLVQIRPYMPDEIKCIQWLAIGSCVFNAIVPFYTNINRTPEYLANTTNEVTTNNFYWTNRLIAALSDAHFADTASPVERYQLKVQSQSTALINKYDEKFITEKISNNDAKDFLEKANDEVTRALKVETDILLNDVLYVASCEMKNKFSRSDA